MSVRHAIKLLGGIIDGRRVVMARHIQGNSRGSERELPELFRYAVTALGFAGLSSPLAPSSIRLLRIHAIDRLHNFAPPPPDRVRRAHILSVSLPRGIHRHARAHTIFQPYALRDSCLPPESPRFPPRGPEITGSPLGFQVRGSRLKRVRARSSFRRRHYGASGSYLIAGARARARSRPGTPAGDLPA